MDRSLGFGSTAGNSKSPSSDSVSLRLRHSPCLNLATHGNSQAHSTKGTPSPAHAPALTACRSTVSGSPFTPLPGSFSPFPHGTASLSVAVPYLALEGGPPRFPQDSSCPTVLRCQTHGAALCFVYGTFTPSGRPSQWRSTTQAVCHSARTHTRPPARPSNPCHATVHALHMTGLGSSPFARRYSGNHGCFLLLQVLRWFSSLGLASID
jgi:hypothetical protein